MVGAGGTIVWLVTVESFYGCCLWCHFMVGVGGIILWLVRVISFYGWCGWCHSMVGAGFYHFIVGAGVIIL